MTTVKTTRLYRLNKVPPDFHQRIGIPAECLEVGAMLWLHASRASSLGGYVGTFSATYDDGYVVGPKGQEFRMLIEYVSPVY